MAWTDSMANGVFSIVTGDGKTYTPLWKPTETSADFNISQFDFISKAGTYIDRREIKGSVFPLVFWFQGDDNIEQAAAFFQSAKDKRAWVVAHPQYGSITGHPAHIGRNDREYNLTEVSVDFLETITDNPPVQSASVPDELLTAAYTTAIASSQDFSGPETIEPGDVVSIKESAGKLDLNIGKLLNTETYADYQAEKTKAFAAIDDIAAQPEAAILGIHSLLRVPAEFGLSVTTRGKLFGQLYNQLAGELTPDTDATGKRYFEAAGAAVISAFTIAAVNPLPGDYQTRMQVATISAQLSAMFQAYVQQLNGLYVPITGAATTAYAAGHGTQSNLQGQVLAALQGLNSIASGAKQERSIILEADSNLILLTHRFMGLDAAGDNLEAFRAMNGIKNRELLKISKGRTIKYLA